MAPTRRARRCDDPRPARPPRPRRARPVHLRADGAWRRLLRDGRVYVAEPTDDGVLVTVLAGGEGGVRRVLLGGVPWPSHGANAVGLAAFLLEDATGRRPPEGRAEDFAGAVLTTVSDDDRFVVSSLDLCCWTVVHAVLDEQPD